MIILVDLLTAHKHEIEYYLTALFSQQAPEAIGNDYLTIGTVDKNVWKEGLKQQHWIDELFQHTSDFATYYEDLQLTRAGYYKAGQKPPLSVPHHLKIGSKSTLTEPESDDEWFLTLRLRHLEASEEQPEG
jgi:hypothetical protein